MAGAQGDGGTGPAAGSAGSTADSGGAGEAGGAMTTSASEDEDDRPGCARRASRAPADSGLLALWPGLAFAGVARRRRTR